MVPVDCRWPHVPVRQNGPKESYTIAARKPNLLWQTPAADSQNSGRHRQHTGFDMGDDCQNTGSHFVQAKPIKAICQELNISRKVLRSGETAF